MEEWNNIPEIGDHSLKLKRAKEKEIYTPVPDSVIQSRLMQNSMEAYLDPRQQVLGGFETPSGMSSESISAAREKVVPRFPFLLDPLSEAGSHVGQRERADRGGSPRLSNVSGQYSHAAAGPNHRFEQRASNVPPVVLVEPDEPAAVDLRCAHRGAGG